MPKKILIIGANGRLGRALWTQFDDSYEVIGLQSSDLNFTWPAELIRIVLDPIEFDIAVITAAFNDVDRCQGNPVADMINGHSVGVIAEVCAEKKARLIHFSTNYVFDGEKKFPYLESDPTNPISDYGKSKLLGEELALKPSDKNLVIRLSWLFGPGDEKLEATPDWSVRQAASNDSITIVGDCWASPGYTPDVAEAVLEVLENPDATGLLHLANKGSCSWQEFGQHSIDCAIKYGVPIKAEKVGASKLEDMFGKPGRAQRPQSASLSVEKYEALTGISLPNWEDAVEHYVKNTVAPRYLRTVD